MIQAHTLSSADLTSSASRYFASGVNDEAPHDFAWRVGVNLHLPAHVHRIRSSARLLQRVQLARATVRCRYMRSVDSLNVFLGRTGARNFLLRLLLRQARSRRL